MTRIKIIYIINYTMYITYCKANVVTIAMIGTIVLTGCAHRNTAEVVLQSPALDPIDLARAAYENGEYYKARLGVQAILEKTPDNTAAQQLMGDVLDKEIARQKEAVLSEALDEAQGKDVETPRTVNTEERFSDGTNQVEIKNWLERSRTLLYQRQYDLALFAAEKVFIYDANNHEASRLIDNIKNEAVKNGKAESLFLSKMYKEEISERVGKYRGEAQTLMNEDKNQQAQFTLQKILLLEPEDPESLKMFRELQKKQKKAAA